VLKKKVKSEDADESPTKKPKKGKQPSSKKRDLNASSLSAEEDEGGDREVVVKKETKVKSEEFVKEECAGDEDTIRKRPRRSSTLSVSYYKSTRTTKVKPEPTISSDKSTVATSKETSSIELDFLKRATPLPSFRKKPLQ
jgi:hypothetical protein